MWDEEVGLIPNRILSLSTEGREDVSALPAFYRLLFVCRPVAACAVRFLAVRFLAVRFCVGGFGLWAVSVMWGGDVLGVGTRGRPARIGRGQGG